MSMNYTNNHRGMGPAPASSRLTELLDGIRAEFESQARAGGEYEHSSMWTVFLNRALVAATRRPRFALVERPIFQPLQ